MERVPSPPHHPTPSYCFHLGRGCVWVGSTMCLQNAPPLASQATPRVYRSPGRCGRDRENKLAGR